MRALTLAALLILLAGCGGSPSPTRPSPTPTPTPAPAPPPAPVTITVTDTVTGAPISGFSRTVSGTRATVSASGYVTRELASTVTRLDLIPLAGFDLDFYRQLVRGTLDRPVEPLRRLTQSPRIYIRTVDEAGAPMDSSIVSGAERVIRSSAIVEAYTGGQFGLAGIEAGSGTREGLAGWITIRWQAGDPNVIGCGRAAIAGGWIELNPACRCGGQTVFPRGIKHDIGHALGFWHTDNPNDVMYPAGTNDCDNNPSQRERHHAAIAYKRPVGNRDVDSDPTGAAFSPSAVVVN